MLPTIRDQDELSTVLDILYGCICRFRSSI